jgi:hypothetical protein
MARKKPQPTAEPPPTVPAPTTKPAESVTNDAPPAVAGGNHGRYHQGPENAGKIEVLTAVDVTAGVTTPAVAGGFRFNVHLSGPDRWPTLTVEAADAGDAIAKYRAECGIHETTHPFVAEPATT